MNITRDTVTVEPRAGAFGTWYAVLHDGKQIGQYDGVAGNYKAYAEALSEGQLLDTEPQCVAYICEVAELCRIELARRMADEDGSRCCYCGHGERRDRGSVHRYHVGSYHDGCWQARLDELLRRVKRAR